MADIRKAVRDEYGKIGAGATAGCGCSTSGCGTSATACATGSPEGTSRNLGYSQEQVEAAPEGANLGLGCGNPQTIAGLRPGETELDLGSGGGFDCFLAARQVGENGKVIGVDMTPDMIDRARENAKKAETQNVEFRLGEIEHLPAADKSVDAIISNCVINLSPEKPEVFREAFRVLKPGGRLAITDIVATTPIPEDVRDDVELHVGCTAGAATIDELASALTDSGFAEIQIKPLAASRETIRDWKPGSRLEDYVVSATIEAIRPRQ